MDDTVRHVDNTANALIFSILTLSIKRKWTLVFSICTEAAYLYPYVRRTSVDASSERASLSSGS